MRYKLEFLDGQGATRDALVLPDGVTAQQAPNVLMLRVPTSMHPNDMADLRDTVKKAMGKASPPVIVVPDYVVACRLVEEAAE